MSPRSPRHNRATTYAQSGLFKGLSAFSELERRIEQLPTEQERGDAFEVFVEAHLNTDEAAQADEVWVVGNVPPEVRRALNLPARDYGYDGVFRTRLGELVPYQAKFRTGRTPLPYRELATFFGIIEKAERRLVITNSVGIAEVAQSRTNFNATRGTDFDRLDAAQLAAIAAWIEGVTPPPRIREPRPHQRAALNDIGAELATHDRATVVMACGTGKTLVALWAAEQAQSKRVLVLVPSLNLLRQTLHEWAKWTNWGKRFRYLCVCSDPKVGSGLDAIEIRPEDTDFPVRTNPAIVRQFLAAGDEAVSVVFCTYQSAPVVGEAMKSIEPFDLGIFDEAHKTTGREGTRFAFALTDQNLPIHKRLFLTATPRHYDIRKRDKEGEFAVVSMDDEAMYGRVAHRLSFSQAAAQKIIVPYKVIISVVDSAMINNALLDQSEVVIEGDPVRAKWVAHQIALKHAVEEHNLKRVITFHTSIKAAAAFASDDSEGVGIHLPQFQRFHVSGTQPTAERDEHMSEFARVKRGVITNARCLTEGVDVPSVDMVAFMNPRRSRVDIVQAVGRAMRTSDDGKTCGYVLVPLFLEMRQGETLAEAVERSDYDEIIQVLNAMRDNDDEVSDIIQALSVEKGTTGNFDDSRLSDKIEVLGPQIQLAELTASIRIRIINELGFTWDEQYGKLLSYKRDHGNCNVPKGWKADPALGDWCAGQRVLRKQGKLHADRIKRLNSLDFEWSPRDVIWDQMFDALAAYQRDYRSLNAPKNWNPKLHNWCEKQKSLFHDNKLTIERIKWLEHLGFDWGPPSNEMHSEDSWDEMFDALVAYKSTHGNLKVPRQWKDNPKLGNWPRIQRRNYKNRKLSPDRIGRLEQLGFEWNPVEDAWDEMFDAISKYKDTHGHFNVPSRWKENPKLGVWLRIQSRNFQNKVLSPERTKRLESLGFNYSPSKASSLSEDTLTPKSTSRKPYAVDWDLMFNALTDALKIRHSSKEPASRGINQDIQMWCHAQRNAYRNNTLSADRFKRLKSIGFRFDAHENKKK